MKAKWLFETDIFHENLIRYKMACEELGIEYKVVGYEPLGSGKTYLDLFSQDDCVVFYGSLEFAAQAKREAKWIPGVYCNLKNFECTSYYPLIGDDLLNNNYIMLPFGELIRRKEYLFEHLGNRDCFFIRPNTGNKRFTGTLVTRERYERNIDLAGFYEVEPHELVVAAEPQNVTFEWRFVIVNNEVVSGSQYKNSVGKIEPEYTWDGGAFELANKYSHLSPDKCWCIDICYRPHYGDYKVMEINSFSCSGLYACNPIDVVKAVSKVAIEEWKEYNDG